MSTPTATGHDAAQRELATFVSSRVEPLQAEYLRDNRTGRADSRLARLRRAVTTAPGEDPAVWELTLDGVPFASRTDEPSPSERAVHTALTLYAVHQQSQRVRVHQRGWSLGRAVRALVASRDALGDAEREGAVRRRFDALISATSYDEIAYQLRGLVQQFRSADPPIPLDYGRLAEDLDALQSRQRAPGVLLRWGRDYHRIHGRSQTAASTDPQTPHQPSDQTDHDTDPEDLP